MRELRYVRHDPIEKLESEEYTYNSFKKFQPPLEGYKEGANSQYRS
jgi:hypothetical protein